MRITKKIKAQMVELLEETYRDTKPALHFRNPFELLIAVILSAQCTDVRVNVTTARLFARAETPAAIVYKATWPEEKVMHCTVGTLAETAEREKVTKTALIVVGNVLNTEYERSKLYDPAFTTEFRKGKEV